ncbi:transmembrane emp24 domain-containing protein 11 [Gadus macrocephalus]|uniref:transmembrane emp24 domain-containing protein 11 n=1 Tax=Gadus macrocephalus TaxID=80720 RepID=UPI0028CB2812|nr:transmembrane emp24 domain-containing protein 11 [Gadus macrocephalus]
MKMSLRGVACCLLSYLVLVEAMFMDLGEQEERCIIEDIPEGTLVTGYFLLEPWDLKQSSGLPQMGMTTTVRDPGNEVLMTKRYGKHGKFTFTSHASGQHLLCFQTNSTSFSVFAKEKLKLHLDVQMGEHPIERGSEKTKENLHTMEESLNHMIDQMMYITRQQDQQREREEVFRQNSEDTNRSVLWWSVVQTTILLSVGFWQMNRLKDFFIEKKLI